MFCRLSFNLCLIHCLDQQDQQKMKSYHSLSKWSTEMAYLVSNVRGTGNVIFVKNTRAKDSYIL